MWKQSWPRMALLACFLVVSLSACAAIQGRQTPGEYVDDATISTRVRAAFVEDPQVDFSQVSVETFQGVVQLSGFVDSESEKSRAGTVARNISGVISVENDIVVR